MVVPTMATVSERNEKSDDRVHERKVPVRLRDDGCHDIGNEDEREHHENALYALETAAYDKPPNSSCGDGDRYPARHAEHLHARSDACEFGERGRNIADEQGEHGKRGKANAEAFTNERRKALACYRTHARGGRLHDNQKQAHDRNDPQGEEAKLRAHRGVG